MWNNQKSSEIIKNKNRRCRNLCGIVQTNENIPVTRMYGQSQTHLISAPEKPAVRAINTSTRENNVRVGFSNCLIGYRERRHKTQLKETMLKTLRTKK